MQKTAWWRRQWAVRSAQVDKKRRPLPWHSLAVALLLLVVLPTALYIPIACAFPGFLDGLRDLVTGVYALTSLLLIWEALTAWRLGGSQETEQETEEETPPLPVCTAIIAAYLPNEQEIILETVHHMLARVDVPADQFQVILAYNTPESLEIEAELQELAARDPRLLPLRVSGSRSKAENVNAALGAATGEIVAVYDADHLPALDCFRRAWQHLASGADMVQGRCLIRNHRDNSLTRTVAVEFDTIYAVAHPGRARLSGTAIFGGSNDYWRRETLARLEMNPAMLTEDIDVSVRALLGGCRLVHDRNLISTELAPLQAPDWFNQRKRWAQGWLEVTLKHTGALLRSPHFGLRTKALWFYLLVWRELYPALAIQFFPLVLTSALTGIKIHWFGSPWLVAAAVLNWGCGPLILLATYACAPPRTRKGLGAWYWVYGLFSLVYTTLKMTVTLVAQVSHWQRDREWVTTPRTKGMVEKEEVKNFKRQL
jgi:cellulose synthase/poly-beta-1,6-N-acetylglucosamine synthase-like glycosyltransferase